MKLLQEKDDFKHSYKRNLQLILIKMGTTEYKEPPGRLNEVDLFSLRKV